MNRCAWLSQLGKPRFNMAFKPGVCAIELLNIEAWDVLLQPAVRTQVHADSWAVPATARELCISFVEGIEVKHSAAVQRCYFATAPFAT